MNKNQLEAMRRDKLIEILVSYTSNEAEQDHITVMVQNNATVKDYVIALADGLKYGNWPWVNYSVKSITERTE